MSLLIKFFQILFITAILSSPCSLYAKSVVLKPNIPIEEQIRSTSCKYVVKHDIDLKGKNVRFADGSTLVMKQGSLLNGTISGMIYLKAKGKVRAVPSKDCTILNAIDIYAGKNSIQLMEVCSKGFTLKEDIVIESPIRLRSGISVNGNGHSITSKETASVALYFIGSKNIELSNISIIKKVASGTGNQNYAIFGENMSDLYFKNCKIEGRIQFTNITMSDDDNSISRNISFNKCLLTCDLSTSKQGWEYGQDHLAFFSVKDIKIDHCIIESKNVNRVIKTSSYFSESKFEQAVNCTDGIEFTNNVVTAKAEYGKQVWDMFCGTVNATISDNTFNTVGFSCVFEDKAVQPKYKNGVLINSLISFTGNTVIAENAVLFKFMANKLCDSFLFKGNKVNLCGKNLNSKTDQNRTTGIYLQGYKSCKILDNEFNFTDEATGLQFALVNFEVEDTEISNNNINDSYRIYFAKSGGKNVSAESFKYLGNKRLYSDRYQNRKTEISVAEAFIQDLQIKLCSDNGNDTPVTFDKESAVDSFNIDGQIGALYEINSNDVRMNKSNQSSRVKQVGNKWIKQ